MKKIFAICWCLFLSVTVSSGQDYKFVSFNIRYDNEADGENNWKHRRDDVCGYLKDINPTVLGIQEGLHHQVDFLNQQLGDFEYIGVGRDDGLTKGEYAAIFYNINKVIVLASGTFWLSDTPEAVSVGWDASMERICTYGLFEDISNGQQMWVFNAHFDHKGPTAREFSAKLIVDRIRELNHKQYPVVLMGDFNATEDQAPIQVMSDYLDDGLRASAYFAGPEGTFNGFSSETDDRRIDYIFTSKFEVLNYLHDETKTTQGRYLSDHLPVLIEVRTK